MPSGHGGERLVIRWAFALAVVPAFNCHFILATILAKRPLEAVSRNCKSGLRKIVKKYIDFDYFGHDTGADNILLL